ncbi:MAG: hypothetical protein NEA02_02645 [Thermoanaerobaculia bacterium]|nr:hypothetical protein [Thermoanaerobaculia bacterium]
MGRENEKGSRTPLGSRQELNRPGRAVRAAGAALLAVHCSAAAAEDAPREPALRIDTIEIRPTNVFAPDEAAKSFFPYGLANALHFTTRASFIQKQLLFAPGEVLRPDLLAETERNLRAFGLFRRAYVRAEGQHVVVETADAWTLLLRGSLSNKGGVTTYSIGAEEYNLLGTGRQFGFGWEKETDRSSRSVFYADPNLFAPHAAFRLDASELSDGRFFRAAMGRPFYALDVPWALEGAIRLSDFDTKLYAGGEEATVWKEQERDLLVTGGRLLSRDVDAVMRFIGSVEWNDVELRGGGLGAPPPERRANRTFLFLSAGLARVGSDWITRRLVDLIDRDEDFNLAPSGRLELGFSLPVWGAESAGRALVSGSVGTPLRSGFALATLAASTRLSGGVENARLSAGARAYVMKGPWTLVGNVSTLVGWNLDPESQIALDGESGLRAYRLHAVEGNRRLVGNVEARVLVVPEILQLVSFGLAAFGDAGWSWGDPDGFWHLADAGVGLRIGITRASKSSLVRIDVARVLHPDPLGRTGWLLSFSSGQAF